MEITNFRLYKDGIYITQYSNFKKEILSPIYTQVPTRYLITLYNNTYGKSFSIDDYNEWPYKITFTCDGYFYKIEWSPYYYDIEELYDLMKL